MNVDFRFGSDEMDLRDGAREFLRGRYTAESLRALVGRRAEDTGGWAELVEMGFAGFLVPESRGGLGMSTEAFALVAEEAGYVACPEPLIDVAGVVAPVLAELEHDAVAQIAAGELRVLSAHVQNPYVSQIVDSDAVLQFMDNEVRLIRGENLRRETADSIDPLRRLYRIDALDSETLATGRRAQALAAQALFRGAVYTSAELLGLAAAMIDMTIKYALERRQFGAAIGSFQAVKHQLATAFTKLEFARPVVYRAAASLAQDDERAKLRAAHAKVAASDAGMHAAETAIQIHGAIGYTFEADLHLWMKRVWALAGLWGDRDHHLRILDRTILAEGAELGPAATFNMERTRKRS